ncbi:NnrS family protein [Alicycliphilus denitrificans]|uniref:NnrS family protein n=1 Tax=Alicycliphilus denitrificans TaxID=179636 RepID=UPI0019161B9C|nr:NnrS family protein [Alicycliphilus denitrificans]MBN9574201.1 NnrS family protein [Alicycliphilus denitrificans]
MQTPRNPLRRAHPVWMCGMRPFFLLAMVSALGLLGLWGLALGAGLPPPQVAGGPIVWHVHELVFGFAMAGVAGFALTALPEFTGEAGASRGQLRALVLLWLIARAGFWASGWAGAEALWLAGAAQVALPLAVAAVLARALRSPAGRAHASFGWALLALAGMALGFYADALGGAPGLRWLHATLGVLMLLIVVAASRISMRMVNRAIEQVTPGAPPYLARPPKRHLAALCITLATLVQFARPGSALAGWLALAAAAAMFHLMSDWHVGPALWRRRFPLLLYAMYACMALGYGALGLAYLGALPGTGAGWHLLGAGAVGLGVFVVIAIAGRAHAGLLPDPGPWVPLGGALILAATALRAAAAVLGWGGIALAAAAALWLLAYGVLLWRVGPGLWRPRTDGRDGCDGPAP